MKNRYKIEDGIITGTDCSFTASEFYETDELLQLKDDEGRFKYEIKNGVHSLRKQSDLDKIPVKKKEIFTDEQKAEIEKLIDGKVKK